MAPYGPLIFFGSVILLYVSPLPVLYRSARYWVLRSLSRVVLTPLFKVQFRDFFIGDQMNSLVFSIVCVQLLICFYTRSPESGEQQCQRSSNWGSVAVSALPAFWRALQCLRRFYDTGLAHPHVTNSGKYILGLLFIVFSSVYRIAGKSFADGLLFC